MTEEAPTAPAIDLCTSGSDGGAAGANAEPAEQVPTATEPQTQSGPDDPTKARSPNKRPVDDSATTSQDGARPAKKQVRIRELSALMSSSFATDVGGPRKRGPKPPEVKPDPPADTRKAKEAPTEARKGAAEGEAEPAATTDAPDKEKKKKKKKRDGQDPSAPQQQKVTKDYGFTCFEDLDPEVQAAAEQLALHVERIIDLSFPDGKPLQILGARLAPNCANCLRVSRTALHPFCIRKAATMYTDTRSKPAALRRCPTMFVAVLPTFACPGALLEDACICS